MKHKIKILIVIIIYIAIIRTGTNIVAPSGKISLNVMTRDSQGDIYGVESSRYYLNVYKMDSEGNPLNVYTCRSDDKQVESLVAYSDGMLYLGQLWYNVGTQYFSVWVKSDSDIGFTKIWERELEGEVNVTDMFADDGVVYVIGIKWGTNDVVVCSYDNGETQDYTITNDFITVGAYYGNGGIYLLSQDNYVYFSDVNGNKSLVDIDDAVMLMTDKNGIYYNQKDSEKLQFKFFNGYGGYTYEGLGDIWSIIRSDVAQNIAILSYIDGADRLMITNIDGTEVETYVDSFRLGLWDVVKKCFLPVVLLTLCYLIVVILLYLFKKLVWNSNRLRYQTLAVVSSISLVWLAAMMVTLYIRENANELFDVLEYAQTCAVIQLGRIENEVDIKELEYDNYIGSSQQAAVNELFGNDYLGSAWQRYFTCQELIYGYDNPKFVFSDTSAYGRSADTVYNASTLLQISQCIENGESRSFQAKVAERWYAFYLLPVGNAKQQLCLLIRIPLYVGNTVHGTMNNLYWVSFVGWVVMILFIRLFLKKKWNFMEVILSRMDRVSRGDYKIEDRSVPGNEFGNMWTSLERMCKNIQLQKYKQVNTLEYINQFAPKNFERLFGKDRLQDIEVGEVVRIPTTMGIISIVDKDTLVSGKIQRQYVHYVNQLMEILFSQEQSDSAIFLQNGSNLETVKVVFDQNGNSALTAVSYSMDCIENLQGLTTAKYDTKPFILLHTSTFNCGIAGGSRQVYPYVTSIEMETLGTYIEPLKSCNTNMVVTESTWQEIRDNVTWRYIGYAASKDGKQVYRLYEILDACSQTQKVGRLKNRESFDCALKHYYDNDLYVARNMFSDIVKECPDDGIARWYAFACDELYNRADKSDVHYELFWTMF